MIITHSIYNKLNELLYNLSSYYQLVGYLNSKSNVLVIFLWILFIIFKKEKTFSSFIVVYGFLYIMYECSDEIFRNSYTYLNIGRGLVNTNLLNGLMLIHPIILYYFYTIYIYIYKVNLTLCIQKFFKNKFSKKTYLYNTILVYIAIILGCWWAEQELAWGGWWSWDFVELLALNFLIILSAFTHTTNKNNDLQQSSSDVLLILVLSIILVRFNIINSIHNFITIDSQNQYFYYIILVVLLIIIFITRNVIRYKIKSVLNPYNYFILLSFLFYVLYMYNLFIKDILFLKYYVYTNIKHIFILLTLMYITFFVSKKINQSKYIIVTNLTYIIFLVFILIIVDSKILITTMLIIGVYILAESINYFNTKACLKIITYIHVTVLILFFIATTQTYIFINTKTDFPTHCNNLLKTTHSYVFEVTRFDFFTQINQTSLLNNFLRKNLLNGNEGALKHIFSKEIWFKNNTFAELYSYNSQYLYQPVGMCMFYVLVSILLYIYQLLKMTKHFFI